MLTKFKAWAKEQFTPDQVNVRRAIMRYTLDNERVVTKFVKGRAVGKWDPLVIPAEAVVERTLVADRARGMFETDKGKFIPLSRIQDLTVDYSDHWEYGED